MEIETGAIGGLIALGGLIVLKVVLPHYVAWRRNKPRFLLIEAVLIGIAFQWLPIGCLIYENQVGSWVLEAIIAVHVGLAILRYRNAGEA
ncbi:hypothetical protein NUH88_07370 [Nisaea acidiphila]|uniref:Uncharacterized protein n=1 Tax=Nisaea acidiphila TaxID=1862145 RepID=A0A9J7AUT4_9PROT|nr:hypothetical protein [Nisaea acidiphila]UUX51507.1 hypothetical protein NUH88_07370 [Nisaea acidiphila]